MTLGERIKKARRALDLTQREFGERLGMRQNTIATYEMNRTNPSDPALKSICREFNISETWLRTGDGEMFVLSPEESVDELIRVYGLDDLDRQIILEFIKLTAEDREAVKKYVRNLAQHISTSNLTLEREVNQEVERYRQQLLSEKLRESQALSAKESDVG